MVRHQGWEEHPSEQATHRDLDSLVCQRFQWQTPTDQISERTSSHGTPASLVRYQWTEPEKLPTAPLAEAVFNLHWQEQSTLPFRWTHEKQLSKLSSCLDHTRG